jgi:predicted HNH restriction endonuclease
LLCKNCHAVEHHLRRELDSKSDTRYQ